MYIHGLVKLRTDKKCVELLLDGKLYANTLRYFREHTDELEGVAWLSSGSLTIGDGETKRTILPSELDGPSQVALDHVNVFCLFAFHSPLVTAPEREDQRLARESETVRKQSRMLSNCATSLGEYAVVITNGRDFRRRVQMALEQKKFEGRMGMVKYYDPENPPQLGSDLLKIPFYKNCRFQHENEYRIAIVPGRDHSGPLELEIGDIRDIAICCKTREIEDSLKVVC